MRIPQQAILQVLVHHEVGRLAATGAEFVALGDAVWTCPDGPGAAVKKAIAALGTGESAR